MLHMLYRLVKYACGRENICKIVSFFIKQPEIFIVSCTIQLIFERNYNLQSLLPYCICFLLLMKLFDCYFLFRIL